METLLNLLFFIIFLLIILILGGVFMQTRRKDPIRNHGFRVEIDGIVQIGMCEVSGIEAEIERVEYREGTDPLQVRYLPGLPKYGILTVKWGLTDSMEIYNWFKSGINGNAETRSVSVVATDSQGKDIARWALIEAFPVKYKAPDFNAKGNDVALETIEISYEGFTRESL
jgi:phage tail-like protein